MSKLSRETLEGSNRLNDYLCQIKPFQIEEKTHQYLKDKGITCTCCAFLVANALEEAKETKETIAPPQYPNGLLKTYRHETRIGKEIFHVLAGNKDEERYENDKEYRRFANDVIDWWIDAHFKYPEIF